jgi:hypothetical protein
MSVRVAGKIGTMEVIREVVLKALIPVLDVECIARKQAVWRYAGVFPISRK